MPKAFRLNKHLEPAWQSLCHNRQELIKNKLSLSPSLPTVKPKELRIEPKPAVIRAKERMVLTCRCSNGRSPAQLQWFREEQQIENENLIQTELNSETDELVSRLAWPAASEDNEKQIKCRVVNRRFPNFTLEDSLTLNIQCECRFSLVLKKSCSSENNSVSKLSRALNSRAFRV